MATHSSILAWRIPWTEETGGIPSMVSQIIRHDRVTKHVDIRASRIAQLVKNSPAMKETPV